MRRAKSHYNAHRIIFTDGSSERVQCIGDECPLCGIQQEAQPKQIAKLKPKHPNLLDQPVAGLGKGFASNFKN